MPGRLTGGQKKLLELARALMVRPQMMLLDEPMAGVNPALGETLLHYVQELRDEGMTFLLVEHDMDVVMRVSERVIVMAAGRGDRRRPPREVRGESAGGRRLPRRARRRADRRRRGSRPGGSS